MNPFDLCSYTGNLSWLENAIIFMVKHGSHAYGLNTETSDLDVKGVAVPPKDYFLGMKKFEQAEYKDLDKNAEAVIYDIRKFCSLAADCNPNIIEVLWADPDSYFYVTPVGQKLIEMRELFISKKARFTFSGYAHAQLKRIQLHHKWLRYGDTFVEPQRYTYGLKEKSLIPKEQLDAANANIQKQLDRWNLKDMTDLEPDVRLFVQKMMTDLLSEISVAQNEALWVGASRMLGFNDNLIEILDKERRYLAAKKDWEHYLEWKRNRNPARAALEEKFGFDTKHGMHLVRLQTMCREILEGKGVIVKRKEDREKLLGIRRGEWSLDELIDYSMKEDAAMNDLYVKSKLQKSPDRTEIDYKMISLIEEFLR